MIDEYIGVQMRKGLLAIGLSQAELATKLGITRSQVHKYEHRVNRLSAARLFDVGEVLEVSLEWMFQRVLPT